VWMISVGCVRPCQSRDLTAGVDAGAAAGAIAVDVGAA
jgi:hypothetical protein